MYLEEDGIISWIDKANNAEVLQRVNEERSLLAAIRQRKHRWLGRLLRHDSLLRDVLEGRMMGKPTRGRKRLHLLSDIVMNRPLRWIRCTTLFGRQLRWFVLDQ